MKNLSYFLLLIVFLIGSCGPSITDKEIPEKLPNIVYIFADDMGYGDVSCNNPESKIQTPNIDKLASEGLIFTDAHSSDAVCSPSRYGLLTGRYCWRTRLKQGVLIGYDEKALIEEGRPTIANVLNTGGYTTAFVGKWHVGWTWPTKDGYKMQDDENKWKDNPEFSNNEQHVDFTKPISGGPVDLGFDYFFGTYGCSTSDAPYAYIENKTMVDVPSEKNREEYNGLPGFMSGLMAPGWLNEKVDTLFTHRAISFIEKNNRESPDKPFFVLLALSAPHIPFVVPEFAKGKSEEGPRGDLVTVVDICTGMVMNSLKELGIDSETIVILSSDNGPRRGANGHSSAGEFRGYKANIWEGGHRVPFIIKWPGTTIPGTSSNELISQSDMFATFASLVSYDYDEYGGEDSFDVLQALKGKQLEGNMEKPRVFHSAKNVYAIRKGDWKLIEGTRGSGVGRVILTADSLLNTGQLYNMADDPYETKNLWKNEPYKVAELQEILHKIKSGDRSNNLKSHSND